MKVLCVIDNLNTGGAQRQIVNLAVGLHHRGHSVSVFCYTRGALMAQPLEREGIHVQLQLKTSRFSLGVVQSLRGLIRRGGFEALVSFLSTPNFYAIISSYLSRNRPAVIVSERFCDIPGYPNFIELSVRQLYRFSQKIVVNSHHQRKNFLRRYPWMEKRVATIYNGYDLQEFAPPADEPKNAGLNILVIAGVSRYKNGLCLVRALDILRREHGLEPQLSWVGKRVMSGDSGDYLAEMEDEIHRYGLLEQWHWLGQRRDVITLLHQHDVLVHPSYGEGLPNAVCEALACGRPVIVSDTLDHPYLVKDGVNGFLFDSRSPGDLARKIRAFSDLSESGRHRMGKMGRGFAEEHLSLERYISDFERILSGVIKQQGLSARSHSR
jgi:GalNAc-alpha-(1->4)-GalNAc-alpha-(1->3)-diNAcBac-PP-undecaprenol alpha-1,4-N-acetyl-D-galactosaminyltransferase